MTLSGGEPLFQEAFCEKLLVELKKTDIHTCVETSGGIDFSKIPKLMASIDLVLLDYKLSQTDELKQYTGQLKDIYEKNLQYLDSVGKSVNLRCPIIPPLNNKREHFDSIAQTALNHKCIKEIQLLPYHELGQKKMECLNKKNDYEFITPSQEDITEWLKYFENYGKSFNYIRIV